MSLHRVLWRFWSKNRKGGRGGGVSLRIKRRVGFLGGIKRRGDKYRAEGTVELSVGLRAEGAPNAIESVSLS